MKCLQIARRQLQELESSLTQPNIEPSFVENNNGYPPPPVDEALPAKNLRPCRG